MRYTPDELSAMAHEFVEDYQHDGERSHILISLVSFYTGLPAREVIRRIFNLRRFT